MITVWPNFRNYNGPKLRLQYGQILGIIMGRNYDYNRPNSRNYDRQILQ